MPTVVALLFALHAHAPAEVNHRLRVRVVRELPHKSNRRIERRRVVLFDWVQSV